LLTNPLLQLTLDSELIGAGNAMIIEPEAVGRRAATPRPRIEVSIGMPEPWTHYFEVTMSLAGAQRDPLDFVMPVWTPGSYLVREFARNVQEFSVAAGDGRPLRWRKSTKHTWSVDAEGSTTVTVKYRVYAFEISVRSCFLDDSHAFISGAGLFMYVAGLEDIPYEIHLHPFESWHCISTGLEAVAGQTGCYYADNFDTLVDSPIEIGNHQLFEFRVHEIPHYIALYGDGNCSPVRLTSDLQRIVETAIHSVGEIPYRHYTFLIELQPEGSGGLEHANSCALQVSRWCFQPAEDYRKFLVLAAHEYFHLFNVKRIRPRELGPFDYTQENYTRLLWVSEGFTEYYGGLIVLRAGLMKPEEYLEMLANTIERYLETPGRLVESAAEASFDAWIKYYRRNENSPNSSVSYYTKGGLIALFLDLEIRHRTGERTLDDVMKLLYNRYYKQLGRGFSEEEFRSAAEEIAGGPLEEIFDHYAYGTKELDFTRYLGNAGLRCERTAKDPVPSGYLGISVKSADGRVIIVGASSDSPAYRQGLCVQDEILAVNGYRISQETLPARIAETSPGTRIELLIARAGKLRTLSLEVGKKVPSEQRLLQMAAPTERQQRVYAGWLGCPWRPTTAEPAGQVEHSS
jgi:predicted metalloprotease with PDZ domain